MLKCLRSLPGSQDVQFHVYVSIGTLESELLSQSTPGGTKWTLVYLLTLYSTSAEGL